MSVSLLSVRNVCECLRLPLVMSKICQGCHGSVWRYLRMAGGCLEVVEGEGGLKGVSGSIFPSVSFNFGKSQMRS